MFSKVFNAATSQTEFFDTIAKPMVKSGSCIRCLAFLPRRYSMNYPDLSHGSLLQVMSLLSRDRQGCAMMAYGTSSAGKTHTMEASDRILGIKDLTESFQSGLLHHTVTA